MIFAIVIVVAVTALIAPWSFHIGDRFTPFITWQGVGRLVDSAGREYGLYAWFSPDLRRGNRTITGPRHPSPQYAIRGKATVCTASGLKIPFDLRGDVSGAWLNLDGKPIDFGLAEHTDAKPKRHFTLYGSFQGPALVMDDHKSMFMYLMSDANLTPARSYTSPVPEKYAKTHLEWGNEADFDRLCAQLPH